MGLSFLTKISKFAAEQLALFSLDMRSPIRDGQACGTSTIDSSLLFPVHRYHHQPICYQASYYMYLHSRLCSMYIHWEATSEGV